MPLKTDRTAATTSLQAGPIRRMLYVDNLRLLFTVLVILHHVCLTYAAHSGWYYYETLADPFTNLFLNILMAVNRTWVLGCFFLVSGYFTPGALDRKGVSFFIKSRIIRIGIPLALFSVIIRPTIFYVMNRQTLAAQYSWLENIVLLKNVAPGPAWFLEVLLVFSLAYALWWFALRGYREKRTIRRPFPGDGALVLFIVGLGILTFAIRIFLPAQKEVFHLRIGNYIQYIAFFSAGIAAYRHDWLERITDSTGIRWTIVTVAACVVYTWFVVSAWSSHTDLSFLRGGLSTKTLIATFVEAFIAVGSLISLVYLFRRFVNGQPGAVRAMAGDAYAVFIFHAPIIVALTYLVQGALMGHPFLKVVSVFLSGTALCFLICRFVVKKVPYAEKIF